MAKSIKHGSIFLDVKTYYEIDGIRLDVELADSTFPRPFLVLPPHWPEGASADAAQRMHNRSFITTCSQKKNPWTAKPFLVELKTSSNGKTRPFAVGDSQCAGEGARGDGERLYFFQFCFLKIAVKQKSTLTWKIFRRSCTIQRTSPLKEKMSWPVPALSSQLLLQKSPWPGEASLFVMMMRPVLPFFGFFRCLVRSSIPLPGWKRTSTKKDLHIREHLVLHLPFSQEFLWPSTPGAQELSLCFLNCEHVTFKS